MPGEIADLDTALQHAVTGFRLEQVPAAQARDWSVSKGALRHTSGGFFAVVGVRSADRGDRLMLAQPQSAVTGICIARIDGQFAVLLQARAEPGCVNDAQFGPTLQSTPANFQRAHGGTGTPLITDFLTSDSEITPVADTSQTDLGERYLLKTKRSIVVERARHDIPTPPTYVWAGADALRAGLSRSAFFNIDLRSLIAVMPWSDGEASESLAPKSAAVRLSLSAPPRADALGAVTARLARPARRDRHLIPLSSVEGWRATDIGWEETTGRAGMGIAFYEVEAAHREMTGWVQPLVTATSPGEALLACRPGPKGIEVCVTMAAETGLDGIGLLPSWLSYPGDPARRPGWAEDEGARIWLSTEESDEGGRFYRNVTRYALILTNRDPVIAGGHWLTLSELKIFLSMSNICSIQLRCLASQLLVVPEP